MSLERSWFEKVMKFVPPALREKAYVAGGFAIDPDRAEDIDVWIVSGESEPAMGHGRMHEHADAVRQHLVELGVIKPYVFSEYVPYAGNGQERMLVETIPAEATDLLTPKPIQILVSAATGPQELIDGFDISTHAMAKQVRGESCDCFWARGWTSSAVRPKVLRWDTPEQTLARLGKISRRYGTKPSCVEIEMLQERAEQLHGKDWKVAA